MLLSSTWRTTPVLLVARGSRRRSRRSESLVPNLVNSRRSCGGAIGRITRNLCSGNGREDGSGGIENGIENRSTMGNNGNKEDDETEETKNENIKAETNSKNMSFSANSFNLSPLFRIPTAEEKVWDTLNTGNIKLKAHKDRKKDEKEIEIEEGTEINTMDHDVYDSLYGVNDYDDYDEKDNETAENLISNPLQNPMFSGSLKVETQEELKRMKMVQEQNNVSEEMPDFLAADYDNLEDEDFLIPLEDDLVWGLPLRDLPPSPSAQSYHDAKIVFTAHSDFLGSARRAAHVEELNSDSPQIAFLGRSNVGKSSLLNALLKTQSTKGKKFGAVVSKTPGRTQTINVFGIGRNDGWIHRRSLPTYRTLLFDCPGYGFAKSGLKQKENMSKAIADFLENRNKRLFIRAFLLIDAQVGATKDDIAMIGMLDELAAPFQIILTKTDKAKKQELHDTIMDLSQGLSRARIRTLRPTIIAVSTKGSSQEVTRSIHRLRAEILNQTDSLLFSRKKTTQPVVNKDRLHQNKKKKKKKKNTRTRNTSSQHRQKTRGQSGTRKKKRNGECV